MLPGNLNALVGRALNSNTDLLGRQVLLEGEPSFHRVAKFFPPMQRPREIVGVKESPEIFGITWDGEIEAAPPERVSFRLGNPPSPYGLEGTVTRRLLDGYLPIVETCWEYRKLFYRELLFGYSHDLSASEPAFAFVRLQVQNIGETEKTATVRVYYNPAFGAPVTSSRATIPAMGRHDFYYKIPYEINDQHQVQMIKEVEFNRALEQTKAFWTRLLSQGMQIRTPEQRINNAYRAWLEYNFLNVDKINGIYQIHDGSGFYERIYGYSAALYCNALSLYGYWGEAEKYIQSLLHFQRPNGSVIINYGQADNGALLFAIGEQYLLSHDLRWFKKVAPQAIRSCEWIARGRASTKVLQGGKKPITYGLLPAGQSYVDYSRPVYSYYSDVYNWLGLTEMAKAFKAAGMTAEARKWSEQAADFRQDILASMDRSVVRVGNLKVLPVEPMTHRLVNQGAGDYYALIAPLILETGFFSPTDGRSQWITRYMEQRGGLLLGLDRFGDGVDAAYTYGYALTQLERGNVKKFLLTLYSMLAYGMSRGTYSAVEVTHIAQGVNALTLPHTYSNTQLLRMLRMMLVRKEGDNLLLASGTPRAWLACGKPVVVRRAPTFFGKVSLSLASNEMRHTVKAIVEPLAGSQGRYPKLVQLWLRAPKSWGHLALLTLNGGEQEPAHGDMVQFPGSELKQQVTIFAKFR